MTYEAWRISYQSSEQAARAAYAECARLQAKIEQMEKQEPSHWGCTVLQSDGRWKEEVSREAPPEGYFSIRDIFPLYALPGAQSAPSIPDGWKEAAIAWEVCASIHREYGKGKDPFFNTRQVDLVKHANDARAMLAGAPEAKP